MTDGELVEIARRMQRLQQELEGCIRRIRESDHPNATYCADDLERYCMFYGSPEQVVKPHLENPEAYIGSHNQEESK